VDIRESFLKSELNECGGRKRQFSVFSVATSSKSLEIKPKLL